MTTAAPKFEDLPLYPTAVFVLQRHKNIADNAGEPASSHAGDLGLAKVKETQLELYSVKCDNVVNTS